MEPEKADECRRVYATLMAMSKWRVRACVYMRELRWTEKCDQLHDMSEMRRLHEEYVGAKAMERIEAYAETREDERRAEQAAMHLRARTARELESARVWVNRWLRRITP